MSVHADNYNLYVGTNIRTGTRLCILHCTCCSRCFIPLLPASLLSTALPAVLSLLAMISVLAHTCIYWNRWEDSQSIYYEAYNRTEIPLLLVLFGLIFLSSLSAFLHVHIGLVYTFGAFVIMNTVLVNQLYIATVYIHNYPLLLFLLGYVHICGVLHDQLEDPHT